MPCSGCVYVCLPALLSFTQNTHFLISDFSSWVCLPRSSCPKHPFWSILNWGTYCGFSILCLFCNHLIPDSYYFNADTSTTKITFSTPWTCCVCLPALLSFTQIKISRFSCFSGLVCLSKNSCPKFLIWSILNWGTYCGCANLCLFCNHLIPDSYCFNADTSTTMMIFSTPWTGCVYVCLPVIHAKYTFPVKKITWSAK